MIRESTRLQFIRTEVQWNRIVLPVFASTAAIGAHDMSLMSPLALALHVCVVLNGTGRAHASVSHRGGGCARTCI